MSFDITFFTIGFSPEDIRICVHKPFTTFVYTVGMSLEAWTPS
jgi:hypothetical protein